MEVRSPGWLRFVEIISGLGMVFLAIIVLSDPNLALLTFVYLIAFGLLLWAIATIVVGIFGRLFSPVLRRLSVGSGLDRKSTRLNSSHANISYAVFCLKKKTNSRATRHVSRTH